VLVARDRYFTYRKLALAANAVSHGAQLFVAAPYRSHPGPHGQPIPETSSFGGVLDRLHAIRSTLPPTAGRIADFIIANATEMVHMSVTEVAERTEAWLACASCSARGFQQVKSRWPAIWYSRCNSSTRT